MYSNPHLRNALLPTINQMKRYYRLANHTDAKTRDVRPLMSFLQRLPQADLYFFGLLQTRKLAVTGYEYEIAFPKEYTPSAAEEDILTEQRRRFEETRADRLFNIVMNGIVFGISGARLIWENDAGRKETRLTKIKPYDLTELDILDDTIFFFLNTHNNSGALTREEISPRENLLVYSNPLYGISNNYIGSVARVVALLIVLKYMSRHDWARFNEKFGIPYLYGQYDPRVARKEDIDNLLHGLDKLGSDGFGAIPDNIKLLLLEASKSGSIETYMSFIKAVNTEVAIATLGQNLTSELSDSGSRAAAEVHNLVRKDILFADLLEVQHLITHHYLRTDFLLNYGEPKKHFPQLRFKTDEREDFEANARIIAEIKSGADGIRLKTSEIYDKIGFTRPDETDDVI